jgi:dTMP kinase
VLTLHPHKARLIVLEGIDGAGKTSLSRVLTTALEFHGLKVSKTRQPTDLQTGIRVRRIARAGRSSASLSRALYQDRRAHHYAVLRPAFQTADVIICDRYFYSSVYQSKSIRELRSRLATYRRLLPIPDITFILLPSAMEARRRIVSSSRKIDGFEQRLAIYHDLYFSLRDSREVVLLTQHLPPASLAQICISKVLTKCGVFQNLL